MTILPMEGNIWYDITWRFKILVSKSVLEIMFLSQQGKMTQTTDKILSTWQIPGEDTPKAENILNGLINCGLIKLELKFLTLQV